ncbi:hypothetical protein [Mycobacterium sp. DBP42]|uniref:hypothetical protein n=1 Tax=Mycobacteriaceae TaxID=1762 RepID=UPI00110CAEF8|nr:hypothetical protein [Mycobacterium sp. DBP42]TMS50694.1 hypothetical protein E0T84_22675 [Mycobacterium sp. DBP42]
MAGRKRSGRAAAEAAFADLMKEHSRLVGDVGATHEAMLSKLAEAAAEVERYENARAAAIKASAVTERQLDAMGYKKAPKVPALNIATGRDSGKNTKNGAPPAAQESEASSGDSSEVEQPRELAVTSGL